ncbi:PD-(D/E)XK nuclease-like domain-containing protein [Marinobacterium sp. MBR-109]|jgi:exodeoxyribonuclease VIII|uniref:PD-(D/E)XK nuclease-like domain-containing protein n=1 Tax=Marinobacterium sp. MBR-109 TaxID=3156462 RepID=UPI00339A7A55
MNMPANPFDLQEQPAIEPAFSGPGFYTNLSNEEYHSGPGISKSGLDHIAHCPSSLPWSREAPVDDEKLKAMDFGSALHCLLLEPHLFDEQFVEAPQFNLRTNDGKAAWEAFQAKHDGKIIMTADESRKLKIMQGSVMAHPTARWIFEQAGVNEASIYWTDQQTGELCRVRPDRILTDHHIIVDVKKVDGMDRFEKHIEEFRYHVQDAMYSEGYHRHFGVEPTFLFLAVSSTVGAGRYAVDVIEIEPDWKRRGHELFRQNLETYHQCKVNDDWLHIRKLERPAWAVRQDERRLS